MVKDFEIVSMLGPCFGSIGLVLLARQSSRLVVVKKLELERASARDLQDLQREMYLAKQLRHPNLLPIERGFVDDLSLYITSPAAGFGSCADLVANHFPAGLSEQVVAIIVRDVLAALSYLHSRRLIHRAVRARHVLVTSSGRAQLTCLRHAQLMPPTDSCHVFSETDVDNINWLSPEILAQDKEGYDEKSDVYSVGITVLELVNGVAPYNEVSSTCILVQKLSCWVPAFTREVSPGLMQLRDACTREETQYRPTAHQLLQMSFLKVKGDLASLLHPVIPMDQVQTEGEDLREILAETCNATGDITLQQLSWNFE